MAPLSAAMLLLASFAFGDDAPPPVQGVLSGAAGISNSAAQAPTGAAAKDGASAAFDANAPNPDAVSEDGTKTIVKGAALAPSTPPNLPPKNSPPPPSQPKTGLDRIPAPVVYGAAAFLGGLQGWFAAGFLGLAAGVGLGLVGAYLARKGDYGAAFGMSVGLVLGTAFGGPIGGIIGAVAGGLFGHFLGKLFFK